MELKQKSNGFTEVLRIFRGKLQLSDLAVSKRFYFFLSNRLKMDDRLQRHQPTYGITQMTLETNET